MATMNGRNALLEVLRTEGVVHCFGNPGTTELPFVDALADQPELRYVLALQENVAVAMADGYAQASRRPSFVNLHTVAGLGGGVGNLTNAMANRTPMVVTAGQQDRRHLLAEPILSGDLTGLAAAATDRLAGVGGGEVARGGALGGVGARAETLGARVAAAPLPPTLDFPTDHPLWPGMLTSPAASVSGPLSRYRRIFVIGAKAFLV